MVAAAEELPAARARSRARCCIPSPTSRSATASSTAALERVGLGALAPRLDEVARWDQVLSNGERQRIAIARLLVHKPQVVILDDALSALEEPVQGNLLLRLKSDLPHATIISLGQRTGAATDATSASSRWSAVPKARCWCRLARRRWPQQRNPRQLVGGPEGTTMNKLNYWNATWSLDEAQCPCDLHFLRLPGRAKGRGRRHLPLRHRQPPHRRPEDSAQAAPTTPCSASPPRRRSTTPTWSC